MTNEEQLLQEARIEAEKVYPNTKVNLEGTIEEIQNDIFRNRDNSLLNIGFTEGYIANAKKQMIEAVEFAEYCMSNIYDIDFSKTTEEIYGIFKQQKQE